MGGRAALYARVSSPRQEEGTSLDGQIRRMRQYATKRGYTIVEEIREVHTGADPNRPGLNRLRELARQGLIDTIVVFTMDRFMRDEAWAVSVEDELRRLGANVVFMNLPDEGVPGYKITKAVLRINAEIERDQIKERLWRGRLDKVREGNVLVHTMPPYGYRLGTKEDGKVSLEVYEPEAKVVRLIYQWYTSGDGENGPMTMTAIARKLTELCIPTRLDTMPKKGGYKKAGYGQWSRSVVAKILRSEVYVGIWHYRKRGNPRQQWLAVSVPPIVDRKTWELAQKRREKNRALARRNTKYQYLMGRRLTCGFCGSKVHGHPNFWRSKNASGRILYYRCDGAEGARVGVTCNLPQFRVEEVDGAVWEWVKALLLDPENLARGLRERQAERAKRFEPLREALADIERRIAEQKRQLEMALDDYFQGTLLREVLAEKAEELEQRLARLEQARANLKAQLEASIITDEQIETIELFASKVALGLPHMTFEQKRQLIDLLDVQATLAVEEGQKVVHVRCEIGEETLRIVSTNIDSDERYAPVVITDRLVLGSLPYYIPIPPPGQICARETKHNDAHMQA